MFNLVDEQAKQKKQAKETTKRKRLPAATRLEKDFGDLDVDDGQMSIFFPNGTEDPFYFEIVILPVDGYYKTGRFVFSFTTPHNYPYDPPKVKCKTKIYHPNIDLEGNVCLNILREDWKPILNIRAIVHGLQFLFLCPNPEDPLNKDAAHLMERNEKQFEAQVHRSINHGTTIDGEHFPPCRR